MYFKKLVAIVFAVILIWSGVQVNASAATYDKAKTAKQVKAYKKAGTSYKVLYTIPKGKVIKVTGGVAVGVDQGNLASYQQFGFSKITYKNKTAYVKTTDLRFTKPYNWAPGIKKKANAYAKTYAEGGPYRFVKSGKYKTAGNYQVQIKFDGSWYTIGGINCKTGWAHG